MNGLQKPTVDAIDIAHDPSRGERCGRGLKNRALVQERIRHNDLPLHPLLESRQKVSQCHGCNFLIPLVQTRTLQAVEGVCRTKEAVVGGNPLSRPTRRLRQTTCYGRLLGRPVI